jgi:hypothetical protein
MITLKVVAVGLDVMFWGSVLSKVEESWFFITMGVFMVFAASLTVSAAVLVWAFR